MLQTINPFAGTDLEEFWQQGFAVVSLSPGGDHTPPSPLTPEAQDAFSKGVTAGAVAAGQLSVPPGNFDESEDWGKVVDVATHGTGELGNFAYEMYELNEAGKLTQAAVFKLALGASISFLCWFLVAH